MTFEDVIWLQGTAGSPSYSAREDRQFVAAVFPNEGVLNGHVVSPNAGMVLNVTAGKCVIIGDDQSNQGNYLVSNISTDTVTIGAAPGSDSRIDLVCIRVNDPNATGPAGNNAQYVVVAGTVAASPVPPAVPTTAIPIAQVLVANGTVSITAAMITDRRVQARQASSPPVGTLYPYAGAEASVPADHLLCRGQAVSRTTYFGLFGVLGTTYGAGDGSTTFNVPDLRGRSVFGLDNMGGTDAGVLSVTNTLGAVGGEELHTLTTAELAVHSHTTPNHSHTVASHQHTINHDHPTHVTAEAGGHVHSPDIGGMYFVLAVATTSTNVPGSITMPNGVDIRQYTASAGIHTHDFDVPAFTGSSGSASPATDTSGGGTSGNAGSGTAHNNMPPYMLVNWIILAA